MLHFSGSPDLILLYVLFHQLWSYAALFRVTWSHPTVCSVSPTLELCCTFQGHLISSCCMFCFTNSGVMLHFSGSPDLIPLYVLFHQLWSYAALFRVTWSHPAVCSVSPTLELCCTFQGHLISSRCMFCFTNSGVMLHFSGSPDLILLYVLFHQLWSYAALFRVTWSHPAVCSVSPTLELCCTFQGHLISSRCMFCFTNSGVMLHFSGSPDLILLYVLFHQLWSYAALFRVTWSHPAVCSVSPTLDLCCTFQGHLISSRCMFCFTNSGVMLHFSGSPDLILLYVLFHQLWSYAALFRVTWSHPAVCSVSPTLELCCTFQGHLISSCCMFCFTNSGVMLHFSGSPDLILLYVLFHQHWSYAALFRVTWSHPAVCSVSPTLELCCTFQGHLISSRCMFCFTNSGIMLHFSGSPDLIPLYVLFHQLWSYAALFRVTWSHPAVCSVSPTLELCCTFQGHLISHCMFCFTNSGVMLHFSGSPDIPLYVLFHQLWSYAALFRVTWYPTVCSVSPTLELCCTFQGHLISHCMFCFTNSGVMLHFSGSPDIPLYVLFHQLCSSANTWCLYLPSAHLKTSGRHASFYSAPLLWNNLPYSLQHFFLNITSRSIVSPLDSECLACVHVSVWFCVCVCVCACMRVLKVMKKISNEVL